MEFNRKIEASLKLNTKGCCFLCLQSENIKSEEPKGSQVLQSISIRQLLRHLQITAAHSLNGRSLVAYDCKKQDTQVDLCESCGQMISRFSVLFQKLEKIQLEMNYFLERIHQCILKAAKAPDLVQNYSKRMTSDLEALSQLAFVDNLRKELARKCLKMRSGPIPIIQVTKFKTGRRVFVKQEQPPIDNESDVEMNCNPTSPPSPFTLDYTDSEPTPSSSNPEATFNLPPQVLELKIPRPSTSSSSVEHTLDARFSLETQSKANNNLSREKQAKSNGRRLPQAVYCLKNEKKSDIEDPVGETDFSPPPSPSSVADPDDEPLVDSEVKLELHKTSKTQLPPETFLRDSFGKFLCPACDKTYGARQNARDHYESVHLNKTWKCDTCSNNPFKNYTSFIRHKKSCRELPQRQSEREEREMFRRQHFKFQCTTCAKRFPNKKYLHYHQRMVHSKQEFPCGTCNKTFKLYKCLQSHRKNYHAVVDVSCQYCNAKFNSYRACIIHRKRCSQRSLMKTETKSSSHPFLKDEHGRFHCPSCTKTYPWPSAVRLHYDTVHLKKKYKCNLCKLAVFSYQHTLEHHKKTCLDTLQKRLKDQELQKSFQFQCQTCDKKFSTRCYLRVHINVVHSSIRNFRCDQCEKSFKTSLHLQNHRDAVHLHKTYPCKFCNQIFSLGSLYRHRKQCEMKNKWIKLEVTGS